MAYTIMAIVLLHIVAGFAWFIWKLEIQGKKKKNTPTAENEETKNPPSQEQPEGL